MPRTASPFSLLVLAPALAGAQETQAPWFEEVGADAGVTWQHVSDRSQQFRFPEIMGGGVALFDYDGDGDLDLYLVQGGILDAEARAAAEAPPANALYRNDSADGRIVFTDVTEAAGVGDTGYGMGAACGDFDRDGDIDLYVTNVGPNVLYVNDGKGKFTDQTAKLKVGDARWGTSAAFLDATGKRGGKLDLFLVNNLSWSMSIEKDANNYYSEKDYSSPNNYNAPSTDVLYTYGRLGYTDSTTRSGIDAKVGNGLGVTVGDYDLDGDIDVYVANDAMPNVLWRNDGSGAFEDVAELGGCAVNGSGTPEAGMGVQFLDLDDDGDLDLYMTHLRREKNTFYRNKSGMFSDVSNAVGTSGVSLQFTGFGMGFHDFDHDGTLDLFVANGAVQRWIGDERHSDADPYAEPNHLFKGAKRGRSVRFSLVQEAGTTKDPIYATSRGAAFGDLDGDGDVDIVVGDLDARPKVLRNVSPRATGASNWIGFHLVEGSKDATVQGATVSIAGAAEGKRVYREAQPAYSYLSSNDPRPHFGLGAADVAKDVRVRWPDGTEQSFGELAAGQYHTLKRE